MTTLSYIYSTVVVSVLEDLINVLLLIDSLKILVMRKFFSPDPRPTTLLLQRGRKAPPTRIAELQARRGQQPAEKPKPTPFDYTGTCFSF